MTLSCAKAPGPEASNPKKRQSTSQIRPEWGEVTRIFYSITAVPQATKAFCRKDDASSTTKSRETTNGTARTTCETRIPKTGKSKAAAQISLLGQSLSNPRG
jgi:hypothetical protein